MTPDDLLRGAIIDAVLHTAAAKGGFVTRADLTRVRLPGGEVRRAIDQSRGIWNPRGMSATLSVISSPAGPYADREVEGGLFHYAYRAGSVQGDNAKLRRALQLQVPIIMLRKVTDGIFVPHAPVYVVDDLADSREFLLALDEGAALLGTADLPELRRSYMERQVMQRLHQADFRGRVMAAYQTTCAVCRLRHGELLDAAHIIPDSDERGVPSITNGLSLCKIHHSAFDQNMLGIRPDYVVAIDERLLGEVDGPMLRHGLQEMHGVRLTLPERFRDRPDHDRLAERYGQFLSSSSPLR